MTEQCRGLHLFLAPSVTRVYIGRKLSHLAKATGYELRHKARLTCPQACLIELVSAFPLFLVSDLSLAGSY